MASSRGFTCQGSCRAPAGGAPPAADDAGHLAPQPGVNAELAAMPATELVAHLSRHRRPSDFTDAALVFAERERRLVEAEQLVRAREAQLCQAAKTEEALRAQIHALQQQPRAAGDAKQARARHGGSGSSGRGRRRDNVPRKRRYTALRMSPDEHRPAFPNSGEESEEGFDTSVDASDDMPRKSVGFDTGVQTMIAEGVVGVGDGTPRTTRYKSLQMNASHGFRGSALQDKQPRRRRRIL